LSVTWFDRYTELDIIKDEFTGGKVSYSLQRPLLGLSYVWVYLNGERLIPDIDFYVELPRTVYLRNSTTDTDIIETVSFGDVLYNAPLSFEIFKDVLNRNHYNRYRITELNLSKVGRSFIAGLLKHAPEITLITNQWVNSFKRLHGGGEAPAVANWGPSYRGSLVRVPMYKPKKENSTRIEFRSPDSACNPYLAYAVMLAAGLKGVEEGYVLAPTDSPDVLALPSNLNEAIIEMEKSELVRETLGADVFEFVLRNKRAEWQEYRRQVTAFELDRYLPVL
jgi:hypothetical protein